jgi:two-component system sensor histidine kinase AlgZ
VVTQPQTGNRGAAADPHFLPDLCQSQAVFMLVLVAELIAVLLTLASAGLQDFRWDLLALNSFFIQWIVLLSALLLCRLRGRLQRWSPAQAGSASFVVVLLVTLVLSVAGQWLLYRFVYPLHAQPPFALDSWRLLTHLLIAGILAGIVLRYLYLQQQLRNQQQGELDARIQALQSRIRPHFLFNSMNSIASLIATEPELAERVVEDLSELFRASLAEPTLIPIEDELALCRRYLEIEKLRLGARLQVDWQVEPLPAHTQIPSLLLQPLLENAVVHGIEPLPAGGRIVLQIGIKSSGKNQHQLVLKISNPMPVLAQQRGVSHARHNRMARANIRLRLQAHYGAEARLSTMIDNDTFTTLIIYPLPPVAVDEPHKKHLTTE